MLQYGPEMKEWARLVDASVQTCANKCERMQKNAKKCKRMNKCEQMRTNAKKMQKSAKTVVQKKQKNVIYCTSGNKKEKKASL